MSMHEVEAPTSQDLRPAVHTDSDNHRTDASLQVLCALGRILAGLPPDADVDWEVIASLARRHGVSPLLFWRIQQAKACSSDKVPSELQDTLQEELYTAAAHGIIAGRQLAEILKALHVAGVRSIVVKGAAVAAYYPDSALRRFGDLDLLLWREDLPRAEETLCDLGYAYSKPKAWWLRQFQHLPPLERGTGDVRVELHWRLDSEQEAGQLPLPDLWARAVSWSIGDQPALRLDPIDTVLHLCRHAVIQHRARLGLRPLCDLHQITDSWTRDDWKSLVDRSGAYALSRPVYLMLSLMEQVLDRAPPVEVLSALMPSDQAALPRDIVRLFVELDAEPASGVPLALVQVRARQAGAAQLRHLLWHFFLPRDGMAAVYDIPVRSPRIWLAYLWRPLDLLVRYGRSTWRLLRREQASKTAWSREAWLEEWIKEGEI